MKKWLFALAAFPLLANAQSGAAKFTVTGKIGSLNAPAKAYLIYKVGANQNVDSSAIENGVFNITGDVLEPEMAQLAIDHKGVGLQKLGDQQNVDVLAFFLSNENIKINSVTDSVKNATVSDLLNNESKELRAQLSQVEDEAKKLQAEFAAAGPDKQNSLAFKNALQAKAVILQNRQKQILKSFITGHTNSFLSIIALSMLGSHAGDMAEMENLYSLLSTQLKNTQTAKTFRASIDVAKATAVGSIAPDFTQNDVNGKPVSLSSFRGKYVLIDFWASWCGPCRQENPNVVKAYNKYKGKKFTILGVSLDKPEARNSWLAAIKNDGLTWTQVSDLKYWNNEVAQLYNISSIPANFLLDPQGRIIARDLRGEDLDKKLAEVL
ncbi:TlpA disulfide reductase family protein [Mucilaginibacter auburnensis]|uniref:Peroxiredoxin n=1 Tax=Mucilaginibacter auburnensis TaxID=1457233 RepID=A0A2H9VN16_9SPHI|nr:TlpA disulfide reductase family protein [Mucilaginibacter auburnensis]PJJ79715.1 peroxiredoxin [Mucilaginibacter auburnensis]